MTTEVSDRRPMFRFGCGHVRLDPEVHAASWGARLIYAEVTSGTSGVVWDRQTPDGEPHDVQTLFPVVDRAIAEFRTVKYSLDSASRGRLCWREGRVLVVMSPQGSYGYLYVTAVLERESHEGQTHLADFEDGADIPLFGNWPPEIVAKREAEERERSRRSIIDAVYWTAQEARWANSDARAAISRSLSQRTINGRTRKAERLDDEAAAARARALALGFTEAEVNEAVKRGGW